MDSRIFVNIVRSICRARDIHLIERSDEWLLELRKDDMIHRCIGTNFGLNEQASVAIAQDKVAASLLLEESGLSHVPHRLLKSSNMDTIDFDVLETMLEHSAVVMKPLTGGQGRHIYRATDIVDAARYAVESPVDSWAVCPFIDVRREIRLVVLDGRVLLAHAKESPVVRHGVPLFNLGAGAKARLLMHGDVPDSSHSLAIAATQQLGLRTAAVDIIVSNSGEYRVLEVNAAYSLARFAASSADAYEQATACYDTLIASCFDAN